MGLRVVVSEACDGFQIIILDSTTNTQKVFSFNQENSVEELVRVFEHFNIEADYEEDY